jgi:hypothetical protein
MLMWRSCSKCSSAFCLVAFDAAMCHKHRYRWSVCIILCVWCLIRYILLTAVGCPPSGSARDMVKMRRLEVMFENCNERRICAWLSGWSQTYKQNNNNNIYSLVEPQTYAVGQYALWVLLRSSWHVIDDMILYDISIYCNWVSTRCQRSVDCTKVGKRQLYTEG